MVLRRCQCTHGWSSTPLPGALQKVGEIGPSDFAGKLHLLFHVREIVAVPAALVTAALMTSALVPVALVTTLGPAAVVAQSLTSSALIPTTSTYAAEPYSYRTSVLIPDHLVVESVRFQKDNR